MSRVSGSSTPTPTVGILGASMQASLPPWAGSSGGSSYAGKPYTLGAADDLPQCLRTPQSTSGNHTPASTSGCQQVPPSRFGPSPRMLSGASQHDEVAGSLGPSMPSQSRGQDRQKMDKMDAWFQRVLAKGADTQQRASSRGSTDNAQASPLNAGHPLPADAGPAAPAAAPGSAAGAGQSQHRRSASLQVWSPSAPSQPGPAARASSFHVAEAAAAAAAAGEPSPSRSAAYELEVQLSGEVLGTLCFRLDESLEAACREFRTAHRLRDVFQAPLETHLELMIHMDRRAGSVDVLDLL